MRFILILIAACCAYSFGTDPVADGLIIHLDAGSLTGLNDGDAVTSWSDLAIADPVDGSVAASGYGLPVFKTDMLNGNPAVQFARAESDLLFSGDWSLPDPGQGLTIITVCTGGTSGSVERVLQIGAAAGTASHLMAVDVSANTSGCRYNDGYSLSFSGSNPVTAGIYHIAVRRMAQGARHDGLYYAVNDLQAESLNSNNPGNVITFDSTSNHISLGNGRNPAISWYPDYYNGYLAEVLVYNAQLTSAQIAKTCGYLSEKYNLPFAIPGLVINQSGADTKVREDGYNDEITITLISDPGQYPVTINLDDVLDPDQIVFTPSQVSFTNGDWQQLRTIIVSALDDDFMEREIHDSDIAFSIVADPASVYYGQTVSNVTVQIEDNDCGAWGFSNADINLDCSVNLLDFVFLAEQWLICGLPDPDCQNF